MTKKRDIKPIILEGLYEESALGIFKLIRGFADLRDLAEISEPFEMTPTGENLVQGHQRPLLEEHAEEIKNYILQSDTRFLPEVILSVRAPSIVVRQQEQSATGGTSGVNEIRIRPASRSPKSPLYRVEIDRPALDTLRAERRIRRIDGNHRLHLANTLPDPGTVPTKYRASFCFIILGEPGDLTDDYAESLIFYTLNKTAVSVDSEHALRLLLDQPTGLRPTASDEFERSPELHFTRLLRDRLAHLPTIARARLSRAHLTTVENAAKSMLTLKKERGKDLASLNAFADDLFDGLGEIIPSLDQMQPGLCDAEYFLELVARVWQRTPGDSPTRVREAVRYLSGIGNWLRQHDLISMSPSAPFAQQILDIYDRVQSRVPKNIFLARWYPGDDEGEAKTRASLRLEQIKRGLKDLKEEDGIDLKLIDMGTQPGGTFPIHQKMYEAIESSDIILVDLTGNRPNVHVEAGYALHKWGVDRLLFLFEPKNDGDKPPFDLNTFRYEVIHQAAEIPGLIVKHVREILVNAGASVVSR
ncbi:MAG: hypothetical protein WAM82_15360 [Thermoanaerobaculia bacterium]